jgi:hypothetical protein
MLDLFFTLRFASRNFMANGANEGVLNGMRAWLAAKKYFEILVLPSRLGRTQVQAQCETSEDKRAHSITAHHATMKSTCAKRHRFTDNQI